MAEPKRPETIPTNAEWNAEENEWELGPKNPEGQPTGDWTWWRPDGSLCCKASYDDHGQLHGLLERWHQNGERAQWAPWVHGRTHGVQVWTLATHGPSDKHSRLPPNLPNGVMRMDMAYYHGVPDPYHFTLFGLEGIDTEIETDESGRVTDLAATLEHAMPETTLLMLEPAKSVQGATLVDDELQLTRWVLAGRDGSDWKVREHGDGTARTWIVSTDTLNRCFTLSTEAYPVWMAGRRPEGVPDHANFDRARQLWWAGELVEGKRVGEWRAWDEQGRLRARQRYGNPDELEGVQELYDSDGTTVFSGRWREGKKHGRWTYARSEHGEDVDFPIRSELVWKVVKQFDASGAEFRAEYFRKDGQSCSPNGEDPVSPEYRPVASIEGWLERHLAENPTERASEDITNCLAHVEDLLGVTPPSDMERIIRFVLREDRQWGYAWHWRLFIDGSRAEIRGNTFENFLRDMQRWPHDCAISDWFAGVMSLGRQEHAEQTQYVLSWIEPELGLVKRPPVWLYNEATQLIDRPLSIDLDHLAALSATLQSYRIVSVDEATVVDLLQKASGNVRLTGQLEGLERLFDLEFEPWEAPHTVSADLSRRSAWIVRLLLGDPDVAEHIALDDSDLSVEHHSLESAVRYVPFGLYRMWRMFFLEQDDELMDEVLPAMMDSPARLLRDCAELMREVLYGREDVGAIEDIHALRDQFTELDVKPAHSPN